MLVVLALHAFALAQPPPSTTTMAFARHPNTNCFPGHGGSVVAGALPQGYDLASLDRCKAKCIAQPGCHGVTVRERIDEARLPGERGRPVTCWLRSNIVIEQCERKRRRKGRAFDTHVLRAGSGTNSSATTSPR